MISRREAIEYFIIACLMAIDKGKGYSAYLQCKDYISSEMFNNKQLRWVYKIICEMYENGWSSTCADDISTYLIENEKVPFEKMSSICYFLIEVYLQFCNMTQPVTGVRWTINEAVSELTQMYEGYAKIELAKIMSQNYGSQQ